MIVREIHERFVLPYRTQEDDSSFISVVIAPLVIPDVLRVEYCRELARDGAAIFGTKSALFDAFGSVCDTPDEVMRELGVNPDTEDPIDALQDGLSAELIDEVHLPEGWDLWFNDANRLSRVLDQARRSNVQVIELPSLEGSSGVNAKNG